MLKAAQVYVVVDRLLGREKLTARPEDLDEPWATLHQSIGPLDDPTEAGMVVWQAAAGFDDRLMIVEQVMAAMPGPPHNFPSLNDLAGSLPEITWLWPGWIPQGLLTLLGGAPGAGKSLVALDLARRVLAGAPFPDQENAPRSSVQSTGPFSPDLKCGCPSDAHRNPPAAGETRAPHVLYVDAEAVPQVLNQRASGWGLDRERLFLMLPTSHEPLDLGSMEHQDRLVKMVCELEPAFIVVDSLSSISLKGENNVEDVREILGFLNTIAGEFDVALLLIHHLRKRGQMAPRNSRITTDEFRGSSHIIARACSVIALGSIQTSSQPDAILPRRLEVVKSNLGPPPPALGVHLETGDDGAPQLSFGPAPTPYRTPTQADDCATWLLELLSGAEGPMKPKEIVPLAQQAGFSRTTLYRARRQLANAVSNTGHPRDPDNRWHLAQNGP